MFSGSSMEPHDLGAAGVAAELLGDRWNGHGYSYRPVRRRPRLRPGSLSRLGLDADLARCQDQAADVGRAERFRRVADELLEAAVDERVDR